MGSCFSTYSEPLSQLTAKVISVNGNLREYSIEVPVSRVLEFENPESSFVCNSDRLYYDEFIQPLDLNEEIQMGQIYFILPSTRLQYRLTASDMAALAVKASLAIGKTNSSKKKNSRIKRISPVSEVNFKNQKYNEERFDGVKRFSNNEKLGGITRSGSVKKLQRNASKRAKMAIRSFRLRLNTIHEGSVAE